MPPAARSRTSQSASTAHRCRYRSRRDGAWRSSRGRGRLTSSRSRIIRARRWLSRCRVSVVSSRIPPLSRNPIHCQRLTADGRYTGALSAENVTALFYRGFKIKGGAQYLVCLDCDSGVDTTPHLITVDAHDPTEDGTQPPVSTHGPYVCICVPDSVL